MMVDSDAVSVLKVRLFKNVRTIFSINVLGASVTVCTSLFVCVSAKKHKDKKKTWKKEQKQKKNNRKSLFVCNRSALEQRSVLKELI